MVNFEKLSPAEQAVTRKFYYYHRYPARARYYWGGKVPDHLKDALSVNFTLPARIMLNLAGTKLFPLKTFPRRVITKHLNETIDGMIEKKLLVLVDKRDFNAYLTVNGTPADNISVKREKIIYLPHRFDELINTEREEGEEREEEEKDTELEEKR